MCFCILLTNLFNTGSYTAGWQMQRSATKIQFFCLSVTVPKKNRKTVGVCFTRQTFCLSFSLVKLERSYIWLWFAVTWLLVIVMHFLSEWSCRALCGTLNSLNIDILFGTGIMIARVWLSPPGYFSVLQFDTKVYELVRTRKGVFPISIL